MRIASANMKESYSISIKADFRSLCQALQRKVDGSSRGGTAGVECQLQDDRNQCRTISTRHETSTSNVRKEVGALRRADRAHPKSEKTAKSSRVRLKAAPRWTILKVSIAPTEGSSKSISVPASARWGTTCVTLFLTPSLSSASRKFRATSRGEWLLLDLLAYLMMASSS